MTQYGDMTSAEVAEEAEHERADLAHTLEQIRENLQPRNVVDEVMSHAKANSADVSDRMVRLARANPIATAIIGIGAAMLFGAGRRRYPAAPVAGPRWTDRTAFPSGASPDPRLNPTDRDDTDRPVARFADQSDADRVVDPFQPTRHAMTSLSAIKHPRSGLYRLIDEQPLILAALGVAVGAAIGSAIPSTEIEATWMGDASQTVKQNASAAARQQLAQLKATADQTFEQMKTTVAEHGASADNLTGLVRDLGDDVRDASQSLGRNATGSQTQF